ncbi:MAG: hypothetical protein ACI4KF_04060 [Huintestinicola sp.]
MGVLNELYNIPVLHQTKEEQRISDLYSKKIKEYKEYFNDDFTTEFLPMTKEEIILNIDKCIKYNRKWEGFIVPEMENGALI